MVRTKADAGATKVSAAKAPRKVLSGGGGGSSSSAGTSAAAGKNPGRDKYSGGNSYNPQPVPEWQKGISNFFKSIPKPETSRGDSGEGSSSPVEPMETTESPSISPTNFQKNGVISDEDE